MATIIDVIKVTSSISLKRDYEVEKTRTTENFNLALPIEKLELYASKNPIDSVYYYGPIAAKKRIYRQVEAEPVTSIESQAVTESTSYESKDTTVTFDSLTTTELLDSNNTVLPGISTETYSPDSQNVIESINTVTPITLTEKEGMPDNTVTVEVPDYSIDNKNYNYESSSKSSKALETTTFSPSKENESIKSDKDLSVLGISKTKISNATDIFKVGKQTEKIIIIHPSKQEKYVWLKETIHDMLETTMLKKETEDYMVQLQQRYEDLPIIEADNNIWRKYSRAVVEYFVLDLCSKYPHYTQSQEWIDVRSYDEEEYHRMYNTTLLNLKSKKEQTAIQFAAPVRRAADIYKAVLDTPIGIVQSKCKADMPHWMCFAEYVVRLADISESCEHIWYHAQVHLTVLRSVRDNKDVFDPSNVIINEIDSRLSKAQPNDDVNYLFDFIIQTLNDIAKRLKDILLSEASLYSLIRGLQSEDKLKCLNIDDIEI